MPNEATTETTTATSETTEETNNGEGTGNAETQTATTTTTEAERKFTQADLNSFLKRETQRELKKEIARMEVERKEKEKPELERLQGELARANASLKERDARDTVIEAVSEKKYGAKNPRAVYRLVKDDLETDDKGAITNLKDVLNQAKLDYPELFITANASIDGNRGRNAAPGTVDMSDVIRQMRR